MIISALADAAIESPRRLVKHALYSLRRVLGMRTHEITVDGTKWSWLEVGPKDAEVIVLLHGYAASKDNWMLYAPLLARQYRVICPDLPGFGESSRTLDADHTINAQVSRLKAFLDAVGVERCHIGGNSMGGYIALKFAMDFPDRVISLGLFANAGVSGAEKTDLQAKLMDGQNPLYMFSLEDVRRVLPLVMHNPPYIPMMVKLMILAEHRRHGDLLRQIYEQLMAEAQTSAPLDDRMHSLTVPTFIVWGKEDQLLHYLSGEYQHERIPNSELVVFDGVGHAPMIERPCSTARHHLDFLTRSRAA